MKKNYKSFDADEMLHHLSGASSSEQFLNYVFETVGMDEWIKVLAFQKIRR
jgi:hypothetical protein